MGMSGQWRQGGGDSGVIVTVGAKMMERRRTTAAVAASMMAHRNADGITAALELQLRRWSAG